MNLWNRKALWGAQLGGNLVLAALAWGWLNLPEGAVVQVLASAALALVILVGALWLHGVTLAAFRSPAGVPWIGALKRVPLLAAWTLVAGGAAYALPGVAVLAVFLVWVPLASVCATPGARPAAALKVFRDWRYYAGFAVWMVTGLYLPVRLVWWIPLVKGVAAETASMAARFLLAYLFAITSWRLLAALAGREAAADPIQNSRQTVIPHEATDA